MISVKKAAGLLLMLLLTSFGCSPAEQTTKKDRLPPGLEGKKDHTESIWQADAPTQLPLTAFGKVHPLEMFPPSLVRSGQTESIDELTLATSLPEFPSSLPVYQIGNYRLEYRNNVTLPPHWEFEPRYSLVSYNRHLLPLDLGKGAPERIAASLLNEAGLLMPDSQDAVSTPRSGWGPAVQFYRHLDDLVVYGDKPACVSFDQSGLIINIHVRRRPLVSRSLYPLRTPGEAWQALKAGEWYEVGSSTCQDGGVEPPPKFEQFRVTTIELAYWEPHSDREVQVMIPYYLFRNEQGHTLYVPAVKVEWIDLTQQ